MADGAAKFATNRCFDGTFRAGFNMVRRVSIWQTSQVTESNATQHDLPGSPSADIAPEPTTPPERAPRPREVGGRDGPDPTRYGDWEKGGRCIDF
jgi:hypothetical protein